MSSNLETRESEPDSVSVINAPSIKEDTNSDLGKFDQEEVQELPKKPASAYVSVAVICLMVAFGGFIFGWDTGTISGFVAQTDFKRRFGQLNSDGEPYLSKVRTGLMVSIFCIGCAIGGIVFSKLGDIYGRRIALVIVTVVYVVGLIISIASIDKWYQYFIGRIISGMGVGGIAIYSPLLISEVSPKHIRGTLISCFQLMITLGIFLGYCTNYGTKNYDNSVQWRVPLGLGFAWALFMVTAMFMVPESPRFLITQNRIEEAKRSVAKSNRVSVEDPAVQVEVDLLAAGIESEKAAGEASWSELFSTDGKILQRLIMGVMLQSLQQLTGANYFFYYGTTIFKSIGLEDSFQTSIIIGIVNFASTFVGIYFVERFGRRKCLLWGAVGMICCFVVFASVGVTKLWPEGANHKEISSKGAGNCMICFTCFFIFCFSTTWAPIAYVIVAESFPLRVKAKGMSLSVAANWMWNFLLGFFTPFITNSINFYYGYVFMGCLVFAWFYVFFFVPETKGLSLEEVNTMWIEGALPWKSAQWVPPSRRDADYNAAALTHDEKPWYKRML
ncbi:similar to Saccharomyces cerevisiae YHR092C HXT4 High-affinity glucose transporter of the major facilitator superfamily [Maudiozyma saulgeensis]|uniref:Similar to Saccharomyces cerevisiae YHR092C HXT4 High-affinity glucose transporter of the major facilitator superfamily n=1 Tax=Maudiozyma saulgeensis TaxID=1789683 RepID=A0A1X7R408_9SACH|nr:similar to Saccharomyces cerevisiae YHR092C HXT4 High-affinity glucose transporter of the major facilitator superfamily [Kazachstania saulgeensis]